MTFNEATRQAVRQAKRKQTPVAVVRDGDEYDTATEDQMDTFHFGANPLMWADVEGNLTACL